MGAVTTKIDDILQQLKNCRPFTQGTGKVFAIDCKKFSHIEERFIGLTPVTDNLL